MSQVRVISAKSDAIDMTVFNECGISEGNAQFVLELSLITTHKSYPFMATSFHDTNKIKDMYETSCDAAFPVYSYSIYSIQTLYIFR